MFLLALFISLPLIILILFLLDRKFFQDKNNNQIHDGVEEIIEEVEDTIQRVKEEAQDVKESFIDLTNQTQDVIEAITGPETKRRGRPKK
jgi:hypothetical protein